MSSGETRSHEPHESELYHQFANWYERIFERCFRIGNIGRIFAADVRALLAAVAETIEEMGVKSIPT